ncbi:CRE-MRP-7 protein [Caenorhabditis remanei]|uniref:CRE-MRP-7 protein n=1 Tax=Caenorhabditis remanei TaxID=31234 RepID=E3N6I7_CAERE|nr:CRE-MRP-7 protein [Caenorhabditis remanei]
MLSSFCGDDSHPFKTGLPNLSICAQHTVLVWVPTAFFLLTLPFLSAQCHLNSQRFDRLPFSAHFIIKLILTAFLAVNSLFTWCYVLFSSESFPPASYVYPGLWVVVWTGTFLVHLIRLRCGLVSSGIQHVTAMIFALCGAPEMYQWCRMDNESSGVLGSALSIAYLSWYSALLIYTFMLCFADPRSGIVKGARSPELQSSFLNRLTLWWFNSVPWTGAKRDLEIDDIFELNERSGTRYLSELWESFWEPKRLKYIHENSIWAKKSPEERTTPVILPSVISSLFMMFRWEFLLASTLKFVSDTMQFASPFLLHELLNFISAKNAPFWKGMALSILMFSTSELRSLILNGYFYIMFRMGTKIQTSLTAAVYKKTLLLSNSARRDRTVGEIVNLMAIDVERFQMITPQIQQFWSCPYQITFALVYLFITLGYSAIPGVVIMVIFVPMNIISSMVVRKWQIEQMKLKDERTKMVNEVLNGIKVVKLYAWEVPMEEYIEEIRRKELALIKKSAMVRNILDSFNTASPFLVALFSFGTFVLSNPAHLLTPQIAFVSLALFNQLRSPMTMIALLINQAVQAVVSNKRLKEFLVAEELDEKSVDRSENIERSHNAVRVENLTATWENPEDSRQATLQDLDLTAPRNSLIAVVGKVGSGKSSLLQALLGEMGKLKGRIGVNGRVAYVPQQPWIQNMTLRDNITFGRPFDRKRYDQVLYACALKADIKILPAGDQTEIGEKGINLSGGQKARVSLARAVYQNLDVYLLDDPLSAVDAHVGRHIFEKVIGPNGLLREKTRILVTHGLTFTKLADEILVMFDGKIEESGTFDSLMKRRGVFWDFMEEYKSSSDTNSEEDFDEIGGEKEDYVNPEDVVLTVTNDLDETVRTPELTTQISTISSPEKPSIATGSPNKLIKKEDVAQGKVEVATYKLYVKAAGYTLSIAFIAFFIAYMTMQILRSFWLSAWSDEYDPDAPSAHPMAKGWRLGVYGALGFSETACFFVALLALVFVGQRASKNLHGPLIHNLMRSPMSFYDTTPLGRILNRCAKDIETIDMMLPMNFRYLVMCVLQVAFTLIVIIISTPLFAVVILPLALIYLVFLKYYVPTSRQLKRLESVHRSPIYSHFGETIQGAASIRAFNKVDEFREHSGKILDTFIRCRYSSLVSNRWLAVRLEFVGNCIIFFAALFAVLSKEFGWITSPGVIGVSVSYALNITEVLNFAVRQVSEIEANIVSVERVNEYTNTPNEAPWRIEGRAPAPGWPSKGIVRFDRYSTRYREGLDLVLHDISADVSAGEKIGIVGRTGAGKSSFALALFRMIEAADGRIIIDDVEVSQIGLHDLRSNITIIPQDPVLFSGTLRFNLDPFSTYTDDQIWRALELAHLKTFASALPDGLLYKISEAGENLSVGQRQLVALSRALLRHTRVLVLDEATAAVDVTTDALIQETIRTEFKECTVFTIAHRLNTIMDYDRIMVLDKGSILEFDSPDNLMADKNSAFAKMVADAEEQENQK